MEIVETFRFKNEEKYEKDIFSIEIFYEVLANESLEVILIGVFIRFNIGFRENVLVMKTSYRLLEVLSFCDRKRA